MLFDGTTAIVDAAMSPASDRARTMTATSLTITCGTEVG